MTIEEIQSRKAEIENEIVSSEMTEERLAELQTEVSNLETEERAIVEEAEKRAAIREQIADNAIETTIIEKSDENENEVRKMFDRSSVEYRNAFMANLVGNATEEQRSILADNTSYGDGLSLPTALDKEVWDQVTQNHPILGDIDRYVTGIALKVTKMSPAAITKKKDSASTSEETYTSAEVTLVGADYHTFIKLSYAEAKMSQGAMEAFLVKNLAGVIGDAIAKDVFAQILADAGSTQSVTATTDLFDDVKSALALAVKASKPVIYAPASKYYDIVGAIKSGSPFNMGTVLGCEVKLDNAATKVTVVDPSAVLLNVIQDTTIESTKNIEEAKIVIGGYCRAESALRITTAASYIA